MAPEHLADEDVLLAALAPVERAQLAGLLRTLLVAFEHEEPVSPLRLTVVPRARRAPGRAAGGPADRAGLLVQHLDPAGPAAAAGLAAGTSPSGPVTRTSSCRASSPPG